jgi:hypothetical protein
MKQYYDRILVLLVLATFTFSAMALSTAQGPRAQTFEISAITFDPNPGFTCGDTNINFTVTNRMGTVVDMIVVNVSAKSSVGSQQWGTNITTLAANQSKAMSFLWKSPVVGTYDIAVRVVGMGQIVITTTVYTVSVCGPHIAFGPVSFAFNPGPLCQNGTVSIEVINDGHAVANDTSVFVSAYGPYPAMTRIPVGSTTVASIGVSGSVKVDMLWTPLPVPGVYSIEVITIDALGQMAISNTFVTVPVCPISDVRVLDINFDPYPGQWGHDVAVNVTVLNAGTESATSIRVSLSATGPANYTSDTQVVPLLEKGARVKVKFPWLSSLPPGTYSVQVYISSHEFLQTSSSASFVYLAPPSSGTVVPNETKVPRVVLKSFLVDPVPGPVGNNVSVRFTITNNGGVASGVLKVSCAAVGPADYMIGNGTVPVLAPGAGANFTFQWKQPIMPGSYTIYAFWSLPDGTMSSASTFFIELGPHSGQVLQNGTYYYYYYGQPVNGTNYGQFVNGTIRLEPKTLNITLKADKVTGATNSDMAVAGGLGAGIGGLIGVGGILGVLAMQKGSGPTSSKRWSTDPYVEDTQRAASSGGGGRGSMQGSDFAIKENGVKSPSGRGSVQEFSYVKKKESGSKSRDGAVQYQESDFAIKENGVKSPSTRGSLQSASEAREDYTGKATGLRESPTQPSKGQTSLRESPSRPRDSASGQATGKRSGEPLDDDSDDDGTPELTSKKGYDYYKAKSDMNTSKGLRESPTKTSTGKTSLRESPSRPRDSASGQATGKRSGEPLDDDSDGDSSPEPQGMAINEKGLPGDKPIKKKKDTSQRSAGGNDGRDTDSDDDGDISSERSGKVTVPKQTQGATFGERMRESPTLPSKGQTSLRESPTLASTGQASVRESPTKQSSGLRESPSKASIAETSVRESPTLPLREQASGQASGKRFGIGDNQPDSPLGKTRTGINETMPVSEAFEKGDKPTQDQIQGIEKDSSRSNRASQQSVSDPRSDGSEGDSSIKPEDSGKKGKEYTGHVTLMK